MIALGVGFAGRCTVDELAALVVSVLAELEAEGWAVPPGGPIAAPERKRGAGLLEPVAARFGLSPVYVDHDRLQALQPAASSRSAAAVEATGLASVAEAAALAAAGGYPRLLVPRRARGPATCAAATDAAEQLQEETP
ncbi:cobalamin biosynthesis protein [Aquisalimonas lutea]|uniref:cobalamin biosynthesis protein n=1 Tax=Aquisalimonas lutea TaxID=1327750 RepID=UPI0025B6059F|nr:cobalamin biosynthesis protein [Aquisalimonas lutea]MDN3516459.1 cobalamin biosynthesis protein [Aquisalimonas lutea]